MEKVKKKLGMMAIMGVICVIAAIILAAGIIIIFNKKGGKEPEIITESNLEKIINVSDLSTFEAVYNGIAKVTNDESPYEIDYYVSYDAKVKAGIDFSQVGIDVDNENKIITITIPKIRINDVNVDIASLDYIFLNDRANTETVSEQAYEKCVEDAANETNEEDAIYELAEENAENIIRALIEPFVQQLDSKYDLIVN